MTFPAYTAEEARNRETFLALMWALSYPGRVYHLPIAAEVAPFGLIGDALLDLETSYFTPDAALAAQLKRTGARALPSEHAAYHFYPALAETDIAHLEAASIGTAQYPDTAATLFIGARFAPAEEAGAETFTLRGPGIPGTAAMHVRFEAGVLPAAFWALRTRQIAYPLGWDVYFVHVSAPAARVIGLPRTTRVERT